MALLAFGLILLLILIDWVSGHNAPYLGLLTYIILPVFLLGGLFLIPIGMWRLHRRQVMGKRVRRMPRLDLNIPRHRRSFTIFLGGSVLLFFFTGIGTYRVYEFSNSVTFCGQACHSVMEPEFVAYQSSPHARVKCVECHVGEGAEWFVKSKLSGAHQLIAVTLNTYERPIPTPIANLRPARETCERCHWPEKFYGRKQTDKIHFMKDEENTRWRYSLLLKIGGKATGTKNSDGIHWHIDNKVEYIANDERRQEIPWVRVTYKDGSTKVFKHEDAEDLETAAINEDDIRVMDCIDCHNRPSHIFQPPQVAVNHAIEQKTIDAGLPYVKMAAVEAIQSAAEDSTKDAALATIANSIHGYYDEDYPEIAESQKETIDRAVAGVQAIFTRNFFPRMKANWQAYPNNIGHINSPGCHRCHNGLHFDDEGSVVSNDCNICHLIIEQEGQDISEENINGLTFKHPEDIDEEWRTTGCFECHGA